MQPIELTIVDVFALLASVVSMVLACMAIWLSIVFYRMSSRMSERANEAAKDIDSNVVRIEKLFDTFYSDTFGLMKDAWSDMRKQHIWAEKRMAIEGIEAEAEKRASERVDALRQQLLGEMGGILGNQGLEQGKPESITQELEGILTKAIAESRKVETDVRKEAIRGHIFKVLRSLQKRGSRRTAQDVVNRVKEFPPGLVIEELQRLGEEGMITWDEERLFPDSVIQLNIDQK